MENKQLHRGDVNFSPPLYNVKGGVGVMQPVKKKRLQWRHTRTHTHQHAPHAYAVNHWLTSCENWGGQSTPWSLTNKHTDYLTGQNFQLTTGKLKQEQTTGQTFRRFVQFIDVGSVLVSIRPSSKKEGGMKLQRDERQKITAFQI